jgi:hypothetical protein
LLNVAFLMRAPSVGNRLGRISWISSSRPVAFFTSALMRPRKSLGSKNSATAAAASTSSSTSAATMPSRILSALFMARLPDL